MAGEGQTIEVTVDRIATGGDGVARDGDGRVVFVRGGLPGDLARVRIDSERRRHAHATIEEIVAPGPGRREPPCPHVADGCGGCHLQHAHEALQHRLKVQIVADCLQRIGRLEEPEVVRGPAVRGTAYRTTLRASVTGDRAGLHAWHSHQVIPTPHCLVAHPRLRRILAEGRFPGAASVLLRVGARTGDCVVVVGPTAEGAVSLDGEVVGQDRIGPANPAAITERVGERVLRVSARSFFQSGPEAAEVLLAAVDAEVAEGPARGTLVDLYSGVGLLAGGVGFDGRRVAVERSAAAVADARHNLAPFGADARVVRSPVERWRPHSADVVIANPARPGLDRVGVERVGAIGAGTVVLVSCDPGALGRDALLLGEVGYQLARATVLDLFPQTAHVEVVSRFTRAVPKRAANLDSERGTAP